MEGESRRRLLKWFLPAAIYAIMASLIKTTDTTAVKQNSGFYFDNGMGQTEVEFMDLEDQAILRDEILNLLGLTHVPDKKVHRVDLRDLGNHTIPHFMHDIYKSLTMETSESGELRASIDEEDLINNKFRITSLDIKAINESDIIMSFANRGHQEDFQWTQLFWFDTSELPDPQSERLLRAELRLYKGPARDGFLASDEFTVKCSQLVAGSAGDPSLLDSIDVRFSDNGWLIVDVTEAVNDWQFDYHTNQGLEVQIVKKEDQGIQLHPVDVGLSTNRDQAPDKEAFMVAYFKSSSEDSLYNRYRYKREVERTKRAPSRRRSGGRNHKNRKKYSEIEEDFSYYTGNPYRDFYGGRYRNRHCQKRVFRVSFRDLGWEDWIIAPDDYEAFYCHGECSFPLNTHMNATNHAIVQTLVHLMSPHMAPKPCCAPTKLSAISVLYYDESYNVILKKYQNMVVKSCGCH